MSDLLNCSLCLYFFFFSVPVVVILLLEFNS